MSETKDSEKTHFGFEEVEMSRKAGKVAAVFHSVAKRYDIMNDLMSLGLHRLWKQFTIKTAAFRPGQRVLDVAGGTGDLSIAIAEQVGTEGLVILTDINHSMLTIGRDRVINAGCSKQILFAEVDAEQLPFPNDYFDSVVISFGLRNVTNKERALVAMQRVIKPGGHLFVLEFSKPVIANALYDVYSFKILPWLGQKVAGDRASYQYLAESIRRHPDQKTLQKMILDAGFATCDYFNLSLGIVALHRAVKA